MSQNTEPVEKEMKELTASYQADKLEFIKNPVAEFLGLASNADFTESELEQRIITHIQKFLMEMGKGYAFVARQQHIRTEKEDYYIDLVFYNYILKCFVLIDLKTTKITHQDVGQMDMYIRMYDEMKRIPSFTDMNSFSHQSTKLVFHLRNSFEKKLKFKRDFTIYKKRKMKNWVRIVKF